MECAKSKQSPQEVAGLADVLACALRAVQVLMKDIVTPVPPEEVRQVIKKCLENAALVNYTRISEYAKIEGRFAGVLHLAQKPLAEF